MMDNTHVFSKYAFEKELMDEISQSDILELERGSRSVFLTIVTPVTQFLKQTAIYLV